MVAKKRVIYLHAQNKTPTVKSFEKYLENNVKKQFKKAFKFFSKKIWKLGKRSVIFAPAFRGKA